MRPYLVWSLDYSHASAGPKALHRLCHELNAAGQEAYVGPWAVNPEWDTPVLDAPVGPEWVAVYPEVVRGNPWRAPHVARWALNRPGAIGGDRSFDPSEAVFSWSPLFLDAPLLHLPTAETDIYADRGHRRSGTLVYVGKGRRSLDLEATEITLGLRQDREALADALNRAEALVTFDMVTGMADLARLCGCPVSVVPDGTVTRADWDRLVGWDGIAWWPEVPAGVPPSFRASHDRRAAEFPEQLGRFIRTTQAMP